MIELEFSSSQRSRSLIGKSRRLPRRTTFTYGWTCLSKEVTCDTRTYPSTIMRPLDQALRPLARPRSQVTSRGTEDL